MFAVSLVLLSAGVHITVTGILVANGHKSNEFDNMTKVEWARFKLKCFFWEMAVPYLLLRLVIGTAKEIYDTVTTALQKNEETEDQDV